MNSFIFIARLSILSLAAFLLVGCSGGDADGAGGSGPLALSVTNVTPAATTNGVSLSTPPHTSTPIIAVFSRPISQASINSSSFSVTGPSGPIGGTFSFSFNNRTVTFLPSSPLAFNTEYEARITTAVTTAEGQPLSADYAWRFNTGKQLAAGSFGSCARRTSGVLKCWGQGTHGVLGQGNTDTRGDQTGEMGTSTPIVDLGAGRTALAVSASDHTCARLDTGAVKCWGRNAEGQLGQEDDEDRGDNPGEMGALEAVLLGTNRTTLQIAVGGRHTCARLDNGAVKCWGDNTYGQLGLGVTDNSRGSSAGQMGDNLLAVNLGSGRTAVQVVAGDAHTCALLDNATVKCWGRNNFGQLGQGDETHRGRAAIHMGNNLNPVILSTTRTIVELASGPGANHTCARFHDGSVKCWGYNFYGQLGIGDENDRGDDPDELDDIDTPFVDLGDTAVELAVGGDHSCARLSSGNLKCWGRNDSGQLGRDNTTNLGTAANPMTSGVTAITLGSGSTATEVVAGAGHTCAVLDNTSVKCWGLNAGRLGIETGLIVSPDNRGDEFGDMDALPIVNWNP